MIATHSSTGFHKSIVLSFGLLFVLLAVVMSYAAFSGKSDIRSKAAEEQIIHKQWEFNSSNLEGWRAVRPHKTVVSSGFLTLIYQNMFGPISLTNRFSPVSLPVGNKTIAFSLAIGKPQATVTVPATPRTTVTYTPTPTIKRIPTGIKTPPPRNAAGIGGNVQVTSAAPVSTTFTGKVYYTLANKSVAEAPIPFTGVSNGVVKEFFLRFPEIGATTIEQIRVEVLTGVMNGDTVRFDWIRLQSPKTITSTNTPTPSPRCYPRPYCPPGAVCKIVSPPEGSVYCQLTPTPTLCGPVACQVPPTGCHYENSTPCSCGTLVCTTTTVTPPPFVSFKKSIRVGVEGGVYVPPILPRDALTVEGWVKLDDFVSDSTQVHTIFGQRDYDSGVVVSLWVNGSKNINAGKAGMMQALVWDSTSPIDMFTSSPTVSTGIWHHFALTKDGSTARIFLDGKLIAKKPYIGQTPWSNSQGLAIGGSISAPLTSPYFSASDSLEGEIDDVRVSAKALYVSDFTPPTMPYNTAGYVLGLYHFDQNVADSSGLGNGGNITGSVQFVDSTVK